GPTVSGAATGTSHSERALLEDFTLRFGLFAQALIGCARTTVPPSSGAPAQPSRRHRVRPHNRLAVIARGRTGPGAEARGRRGRSRDPPPRGTARRRPPRSGP